MSLYHGVAGLARMFGCPVSELTDEIRQEAQGRVNKLKDERNVSPFGVLDNDWKEIINYKEQFLQKDSVRCKSLRALSQFLHKQLGYNGIFSFLHRVASMDGRAIWTTLNDANDIKEALRKRAEERLLEEQVLLRDAKTSKMNQLETNLDNLRAKASYFNDKIKVAREKTEHRKLSVKKLETKINDLKKKRK